MSLQTRRKCKKDFYFFMLKVYQTIPLFIEFQKLWILVLKKIYWKKNMICNNCPKKIRKNKNLNTQKLGQIIIFKSYSKKKQLLYFKEKY
jgi:hypothetical protein